MRILYQDLRIGLVIHGMNVGEKSARVSTLSRHQLSRANAGACFWACSLLACKPSAIAYFVYTFDAAFTGLGFI